MRVSGFPTAAPTASLVGAVPEGPSSGTGLQASRYAAIQDAAAGEGADVSFADSLYESAKERARQVGETVHGIKQGVKDAGVRVTNTLNDNPVSRYHAEGNVGDYTWVFTPARFNVDPYVTLQLNKAGVGSHNELSVAKVSLMKEDQHGEFKHSQGVRAEIVAHYDLGVGSNLSPGGFTNDATNGRFFGSRIEGYSRWSNNATHGWNITVDANAGYVASFTGAGSTVYARSLERFDNKDLGERLIGHDSKILAELETGVTHSLSDGSSNAYYRAFGGAEFPVSMKVRGKDHALMLDAGVSVSGNSHESAKLRPELRARIQF